MTFQEAWEFCSESLFFCRPKGKSKRECGDGLEIIFWENQMKKLIWIEPFFKNGQRKNIILINYNSRKEDLAEKSI